jgi:hypothetical protein
LEAEQSLLGGLLLDNSTWDRAADIVAERDFHRYEHRLIFGAIGALIGADRPADVITVYEQLQTQGKAKESGGLTYLNQLAQSVPSAANMGRYAEIVRERAHGRQASQLRAQVAALAKGPSSAADIVPELREIVEKLATPHRDTAQRFPLLTRDQLTSLPRVAQRIHGIFPREGCAAVYGPSGCGKSFLTCDMLAAIGTGELWFGRRVERGKCVYVALEGQGGVPRRVQAWESQHERRFPETLFLLEPFRLNDPLDVEGLCQAIKGAGGADVVVIDTLSRAAPDADENASADMGRILEGVHELQSSIGGLVILVHHAGKDTAKGMRGHSSLFAALDAAVEVSRVGDRREWKLAKAKDGEDGVSSAFELRVVDVGEDEEGQAITSCVVRELTASDDSSPTTPSPPRGGNQRVVFEALLPLFRGSHTFGRGGAPQIRPCVTIEEAIEGVRGKLAVDPKRHRERTQSAINGLIASGNLGSGEGWLWLR